MKLGEIEVVDLLGLRRNSDWERVVERIVEQNCVFVSDARCRWHVWIPMLDRIMQAAVLPCLPDGTVVDRREAQDCVTWELVAEGIRTLGLVLCQGARGEDFMPTGEFGASAFVEAVGKAIDGVGRVCGLVLAGKREAFDKEFRELVRLLMAEGGKKDWRLVEKGQVPVLEYWVMRPDGTGWEIGHFIVGGAHGRA